MATRGRFLHEARGTRHPDALFIDLLLPEVYRSYPARPERLLDAVAGHRGERTEVIDFDPVAQWIAYGARGDRLSFWRTRSGLEVDLVVHGDDGTVAMEVKNVRRVHRTDLRGLLAFRGDHPEARCLLLYRGSERLEMEGIACVPCEESLRSVVPGRRLGQG